MVIPAIFIEQFGIRQPSVIKDLSQSARVMSYFYYKTSDYKLAQSHYCSILKWHIKLKG